MPQLHDAVRGTESGDEDIDDIETGDDLDRSVESVKMTTDTAAHAQLTPGGGQEGETGARMGMSRSVSDTTLRKHALHLNLSNSVLPSFTPLHQFKVSIYLHKKKNYLGVSLENILEFH